MSVARTLSMALNGLDGTVVDVEVQQTQGLPGMKIVGLAGTATLQAQDRVRAACHHAGHPKISQSKFIINLTPGWLPKSGSGFDLPVAVAVLDAHGVLRSGPRSRTLHIGELSLDGAILPVPGVLPSLLAAREAGITRAVIPATNAAEGRLVPDLEVIEAEHLADVIALYGGAFTRTRSDRTDHAAPVPRTAEAPVGDFADVHGQEQAKLAAEVAAAGGHHLSLIGPPGAGKTMIASRLPGILPPLATADALDLSAVLSLTGEFDAAAGLRRTPPFISPHHTASTASVIGGGSGIARPGAVSLAHGGVLFLDEAPEFQRTAMEALREPLESGVVRLHRSRGAITYPARFQLVIAANPCQCGQAWGKGGACTCSPMAKRRYLTRISGPIADRIDMRIDVPPVRAIAADTAPPAEPSAVIAQRVRAARERQAARLAGTGYHLNAQLPSSTLSRLMPLPAAEEALLRRLVDRGALTMRGRARVHRLAWTLADLADRNQPTDADVGHALQLRGETH